MTAHEYDLVIVGAGSGNMLPVPEFGSWRIAVVEADRFGGTCLNRGCIPSKMLVHTADIARSVRHAGRFGISADFGGADWPAIRDRVFGRIDPLHERAVSYRRENGIDVYQDEARFTGPKTLLVGDDELRASRFVLAAGPRPQVPVVPGLAGVPYLTSDTVMRLERLPGSMLVLGGGYIAAEMSHVFGSLGTRVTIVTRGEHLRSPLSARPSRNCGTPDGHMSRPAARTGTPPTAGHWRIPPASSRYSLTRVPGCCSVPTSSARRPRRSSSR